MVRVAPFFLTHGVYIHIRGLLPWRNFARCKINFTSKSCVLLHWQRYCTALQQRASAKLCGVVQGMELHNFRRRRHLYSAGRPSRWALAYILVIFNSSLSSYNSELLWQVIFYGAETWSPMQQLLRKVDALISGDCVVHSSSLVDLHLQRGGPLTYWATSVIRRGRLKFSGHIVGANPSVDHSRALQACLNPLITDSRNSPPGSPCHTWLQTVNSDLAPVNTGLATAYHRFQNRQVVL